jgi:tetratricopeptide (TPR) repeat protein
MKRALHFIGIAIAVGSAVLLSACGSAASRKASYIAHGERFLAQSNYDKARVEFSNAAQIDPKDGQVRFLLGQLAEKTGDIRTAVGQYQAAIANDPKLASARAALARVYIYAGLPDRALELIAPGLAADPRNPQLLTARGAARQRLGDSAAALQDAQLAVQVAPSDSYAVALLASLYRTRSEYDKAIDVVLAARRQVPNDVDLAVILADLYVQSHQPQQAESILRALVVLQPKVVEHRFRLARYYLGQKDKDNAEAALRAALTVAPEDIGAKVQLLQFLSAQRGQPQALAQVKQLLEREPGNDTLKLALGQFLVQIDAIDEAEALFRSVIAHARLAPAGLAARDGLAALLLGQKDVKGATALIAEVIKQNPRDNDALLLRSDIALMAGDATDAVTDLRSVLRDQPNAIGIMRQLARAYLQNGEPAQAEQMLRTAMQMAPQDPASRLQLAQLLINERKNDQAGPMLEQLSHEMPSNMPVEEALFRVQVAEKQLPAAQTTALSIQKAHPDLALGYYLAGLLDEQSGNTTKAEADYQQALTVGPDSAEPLTALMRLYIARKQTDQAMQFIQSMLAHAPKNPLAHVIKAELLVSEGHMDEAVGAYNEAIAIAPNWSAPYRSLAMAQGMAKRDADAARTLQQGIAKAGNDRALISALAALYERMNRPEDAIKLYEDVLAQNPNTTFATNNLAMLLVKYRKDPVSLARAQKLADQLAASSVVDIMDTRGWVRFMRGDYHGAEALLQEAANKAPDAPEVRYHLAMAQLRGGEPQIAAQNLEAALRASQPFEGMNDARAALAQLKKSPPTG